MAVSNLSPYQLAIQSAVGNGKGASASGDLLGRIADQVFGPAPVTPGSRITYQDAATVKWIDAEGYEHTATRSLDGRDPNAGQWRDNTNRPAILPPSQGQQNIVNQLTGPQGVLSDIEKIRGLAGQLSTPAALAQLDPQTQAALQAITDASLARLRDQFQQDQSAQLANLFGNRVQSSSIATNALAELLKQQGLVTSDALAQGAGRELATRQFLTQTGQQGLQAALQGLIGGANTQSDLLQNLTGQQTQRDIATGGLNLDYQKLLESIRQANQGFELGQQNADSQLAQSRSALDKVLKLSEIIGNFGKAASGVGTGLGAVGVGV
jgi:hypothetical protein